MCDRSLYALTAEERNVLLRKKKSMDNAPFFIVSSYKQSICLVHTLMGTRTAFASFSMIESW